MQFSLRHTILILSFLAIIFSFLFFGREQTRYVNWLLWGFLIASISYLFILFKDKAKSKLIWTGTIIGAIILQQLSESFLIKKSYRILLAQQHAILDSINRIMISKAGNDYFILKSENAKKEEFTKEELELINTLFANSSIYLIRKDSSSIYYGTFGMLDVSNGITYFFKPDKVNEHYNNLKDQWYY